MHAAKRIEIIANSAELGKILDGLEKASVSGYLVIRNVAGKGLSGDAPSAFEATMLDNAYVIAFCAPESAKPALEAVRPILNKFGGSCFISDAMEVGSMRCVASL
ncbi:P-II family nitrogen regulator [Leptolyngbya sp. FACHB-261]|uniref:P-II family nitrogen regulator n=1 Tax=Leptolyngbya sp. FACHB-261 TaxID=2692806 RepID=UPI001685AA04|nr:P-II family nitrogen regulator [Leptolyngbya sp. FACHB-261]MBD2100461.1 P-II family nitrogen regulator [Leptolyngbya sp. FACHB-261]